MVLIRRPFVHPKVLEGPLSAWFAADYRDPLWGSEDVLVCSRVDVGAVTAVGLLSPLSPARDNQRRDSPSVHNWSR